MEKDIYKKSRILYILEAAFEYFINLLLGGAYLAKVTTSLEISDGVTGIITSMVALASTFQFVAIFLAQKKPVKKWVTIGHSINQLFFAFVYLVPLFNFSKTVKIVLFITFLMLGEIINQIINAPKINWFLSLVDEKKRGSFTATKERVSLLGGMVFTFLVGSVMDHYEAIGNTEAAFLFCSIGIIVLMILHTGTLIFSKEKAVEVEEQTQKTKNILSGLVTNKELMRIILLSCLWKIAVYMSTPFYGTYQIKELGFTMVFISLISAMVSIFRSVISYPIGKLADKSFVSSLKICYLFGGLAFLLNIFTTPSNGKVFFVLYSLLYAVATAGVENCEMNLAYRAVSEEQRTGALALRMAIVGIVGFSTTLLISPLVMYIQNNGNNFLGLGVYAQQVVSAFSAFVVGIVLIYLFGNEKRIKKEQTLL